MLKKMMVSWLALIALILSGCYQPKQAVFGPNVITKQNGNLIYLNPHEPREQGQVCNVSATQDPDNYPNSILFLNFPGPLNCRRGDTTMYINSEYMIPESWPFQSHDHLFIVDTSNTIRWFFELPEQYLSMQDPEWSNHPNYISFLCEAEGASYYGYVAKISNKDTLSLYAGGLKETSDPFIWVQPTDSIDTSTWSGAVNPNLTTFDKVKNYFNTTHVKFVYLNEPPGLGYRAIYCADFRHVQNGKPEVFQMERPTGDLSGWNIEAPIVSPNGRWVAYQLRLGADIFKAYIQELKPGSKPIFIADGGEPHFWEREDGTLYIVYTDNAGEVYSTIDLLSIPRGSIGQTYLQEVRLFTSGPPSLRFSKIGEPVVVCPYPMKGGMSKDGTMVGTGYDIPYIWVID